MRLLIFIVFSVFFITSCGKEVEPTKNEIAYYHFNEADNKKLLPYIETQIIKFKNEDGEERNFRVSLSQSRYKELYGVGMGFFSTYAATYFYYDSKALQFQSYPDSIFAFSIRFFKWPTDTELAESDFYHEYPSELKGYILFSYWNGVNSANEQDLNIPVNFNTNKIEMNNNGTQYKDVIVLSSNNETPVSTIKNVNIIYYDLTQGIIGFDDINNKHWRLEI